MKKLFILLGVIASIFLIKFAVVNAATLLFPHGGGTGIGSATAGDVGDCLSVSDDSPFTYSFSACAGGTGGSGTISTSTTIATGTLAYFNGLSTIASVATGTLTTTATGLEFDNTRGVVGGASILSLTAGYQIPTTTRMATWDAKGNGTVTSVDMSVPTGLSISGNPITTSGTLALGLTAGYNIPLTASSTNWNTAYGWGNHATAGYDQVTTAGDGLTRTANDFDCDTASGSVFGCLSSANWTTFNGKQNALSVTHPIRLIGDTLSLAFSTTTANAWSSLQSFTYASTTGISGTNLNFTNATTTSLSVSGVFHFFTQAWASLAEFVTYIQTLYTGGSHVTITAGSIAVDDDFLLNNGDTGTGTYDFSGATLKQHVYPSFTFPATPTTTTATTTISLGTAFVAETWNSADCWVSSGTVALSFSDGTNLMTPRTASTTVLRWSLATNNTFTASEKRFVNIGALTNATISCTVDKTVN
jgi:hypothetical protein